MVILAWTAESLWKILLYETRILWGSFPLFRTLREHYLLQCFGFSTIGKNCWLFELFKCKTDHHYDFLQLTSCKMTMNNHCKNRIFSANNTAVFSHTNELHAARSRTSCITNLFASWSAHSNWLQRQNCTVIFLNMLEGCHFQNYEIVSFSD